MNDKAAKRAQEKAARARMIGQGRKSLDQVREELKAERGTSVALTVAWILLLAGLATRHE